MNLKGITTSLLVGFAAHSALGQGASQRSEPQPGSLSQPESQPQPELQPQPESQPRPESLPQLAPPRSTTRPATHEQSDDLADLAEIQNALAQDRRANTTTEAPNDTQTTSISSGLTAGNDLNPSISLIGDFALAIFSNEDHLQRGGHDPTSNGFNLQQLEASLSAAVDPYFTFQSNIVFSLFGVEVEEAYATTLALPFSLQLRAGQFLTPFGRINASHPHSWAFVDQPLVLGAMFGGEGNRGLGAEASVLLPLPWYVQPVVAVINDSGGASCRSFYGNQPQPPDGLEDLISIVAVKQFFPLGSNWSLFWGLSTALGPNPTGPGNRTEIYGTDLYIKWRPIAHGSDKVVALQTEWLLRRRQVPEDVLMDLGGYGQLFWKFGKRWAVATRYDFLSGVANDYLDLEQDSPEHRLSSNVTFWATEFSRVRLQYGLHYATYRRQPIHAAFLTLELAAGAHAAHSF